MAYKTSTRITTAVTNGSDRWVGDIRTTDPLFAFSPPASGQIPVDEAFTTYYAGHSGASSLGAPITPGVPTAQGWVQFFASGALLLPSAATPIPPASPTSTLNPNTKTSSIASLAQSGLKDAATGVIRLSLLVPLLTVGGMVPIGGLDSTFTYADLRAATAPDRMVTEPARMDTATTTASAPPEGASGGQFVLEGRRSGQPVGHIIAQPFWSALAQPDLAPDGWERDYGDPLTEAISLTATLDGHVHHMVVQVFVYGALVWDRDATTAPGTPVVQPLDVGVAYLRVVGPPAVTIDATTPLWTRSDAVLVSQPVRGVAIAHLGASWRLSPLGDVRWVDGAPWYHVQCQGPSLARQGWIPVADTSRVSPGTVTPSAEMDALSADLARYLADLGAQAGVVVYDVTRGAYYAYNPHIQFIMASAVKVPIMLTLLTETEQAGREPSDYEMSLLTTMIENSNNDSAQALYEEIGGSPALSQFMAGIGAADFQPNVDAWGYTTASPMAMVRTLSRLNDGSILTAQDRTLALTLMAAIESDQQVGVGDTAPPGATVEMKDGWVQQLDGLWAMNSSGIVTVGHETYIIAVFTQGLQTLDDGWAITRHVCDAVARALS